MSGVSHIIIMERKNSETFGRNSSWLKILLIKTTELTIPRETVVIMSGVCLSASLLFRC